MTVAGKSTRVAAPHRWLAPPGPVSPGLRIGLLGGSFNPPHEGHFHISEAALKRLGLDYVWWMVAPRNPLKPSIGLAPIEHRVEWAAEIAQHPRMLVMDVETSLGTRYSIDTIIALKKRFPQVRFVWVMGSDNLDNFRYWRRWSDIAMRIPIAIVTRPGSVLAPLRAKAAQRFRRRFVKSRIARAKPPAFILVDGPRNTQSSTAIRGSRGWQETLLRVNPV